MVSLVYAGMLQNLAKVACNQDWLIFIRDNSLEDVFPVYQHEYVVNSYSKCPNKFVFQPKSRSACNSSFGKVITFIGATRSFPSRNASSVFPSLWEVLLGLAGMRRH